MLILTNLLTALPTRAAAPVHVTPTGSSNAGCGGSWNNACSLDYALNHAPYGSEIWVKQGTYTPQAQGVPFEIPSGVAVYGGFAGSETSRSERNWYRRPTTLSGDLQHNDLVDGGNRADNAFHVVNMYKPDTDTRLDGFVIEGGNAYGADSNSYGGGILIQHGSPTLENLVLKSNAAEHGGGAACDGRSLPWLINVRFEKNTAEQGGALYTDNSCLPTIQGASFSANRADYGGAIHSHGLLLAGNVTISGNTARQRGGGIDSEGSIIILLNSIVWGNHQGQDTNQITSENNPFVYNAIIEGGFSGYSIRNINPAFMEDPTSGADEQWGTPDDTPGFLDLRYNSPAIDKGQRNIYWTYRMTRDLKNWPRIIDHPRTDTAAGNFLDLGGYEAGVIHVRKEAAGTADGSSWQDAYPELREALELVKHSNEVWVAKGSYLPGEARTDTFELRSELGIYGGFVGTETLRSQRNWAQNPTILSGDLPGENVFHVVSGMGVDSGAILDGFTISDGSANGAIPPHNHGGGIYLEDAAPQLANLVISHNQATVGGGLYGLSSSYRMSQSTITRNQAAFGGGIYQTGMSQPNLVNILFTGNSATSYAGALFNDGDTAPDFSNLIFAGNQAATAGGIFNSHNSQPTFRNITLAGNPGGAIHTFASSSDTTVRLVNMIAWDNGPLPIVVNRGRLVIRRSLLEFGCTGSMDCDYVMTTDPHLARLPSPGADAQWGTDDDDYGDLRLAPLSQAIDAGDNSAVLPDVKVDFAGSPRFVDDPEVMDTGIGTAPIVDIGAYEANRGETISTITMVKPAPSVVGQEVDIFFNVAGGQTPPTGLVTVQSKGGTCSAPADQGHCSITFTDSGDFDLKAVFTGDGANNASESDSVPHQVNPADTLVSLQLSPNPATPGQVVRATFSVAPQAPGAGEPTGFVQVGTPPFSCTATIEQGGCDLPLADMGVYTVIAHYSGDANFNASPSLPVDLNISPLSTTVEILSTSPNPSVVGQAVTVKFLVTAASGTPSGTVTVSDGKAECSAPAADGQCGLVFNTPGAHDLIATYEDAYTPAGSTSAPVSHPVNPARTITTLVIPQTVGVTVGTPVHTQFSLQVQAPGAGKPGGEVEIGDGKTTCMAETNETGCDLVFNQPGEYTLRAHYRGTGSFAASTSTPVTVTVGYQYFIPMLGK